MFSYSIAVFGVSMNSFSVTKAIRILFVTVMKSVEMVLIKDIEINN